MGDGPTDNGGATLGVIHYAHQYRSATERWETGDKSPTALIIREFFAPAQRWVNPTESRG